MRSGIVKIVVEGWGWPLEEVELVEGPKDGNGWFFPGFVGE